MRKAISDFLRILHIEQHVDNIWSREEKIISDSPPLNVSSHSLIKSNTKTTNQLQTIFSTNIIKTQDYFRKRIKENYFKLTVNCVYNHSSFKTQTRFKDKFKRNSTRSLKFTNPYELRIGTLIPHERIRRHTIKIKVRSLKKR